MECHDALEALTEPDGDEADEARAHVMTCPACLSQFDQLARAVLSMEADELSCAECRARLPAYHEVEERDTELSAGLSAVAGHLDRCPYCAEEYRALREAMDAWNAGTLPEPEQPPTFDLSFLEAGLDKHFRWDELGRLIIEFSAELVRALQPPAPQLGYAGIKSEKSSRTLCELALKEASDDLEVTISAEETRDDPTTCTVVVEVDIPSRGGWPNLAGTEVTLKRSEQELESQATDAFGKAVFEGISTDDLGHLVFEITPVKRKT